jgi:hypothetical protein
MCFSAQASFAASIICGTIGAACLKKAGRPYWLLAAVPLLFGLHQAIEGVVWLYRGEDIGCYGGLAFASIAFCFWPVYIPLAVLPLEPRGGRKNALFGLLLLGVFVGLYAVWILTFPLSIDFTSHKIEYVTGQTGSKWVGYCYALCVIFPLLLTRINYARLFGVLVALFLMTSLLFFRPAQFSVWCFFAAASSVLVYLSIPAKRNI